MTAGMGLPLNSAEPFVIGREAQTSHGYLLDLLDTYGHLSFNGEQELSGRHRKTQ